MILQLKICHDIDDDSAPVDYSYVSSVREGRRRRQMQNMKHDESQGDKVTHRSAEQVLMPHGAVTQGLANGAQASSIAYPEDYGIPDNPFEVAAQPIAQAEDVSPNNRLVVTDVNGSQYQEPASPEMPEWLRVAQQNHIPLDHRRPQTPCVTRAPQQDEEVQDDVKRDILGRPLSGSVRQQTAAQEQSGLSEQYANAGYPQELLWQQQELDREHRERSGRRRHGAQRAGMEKQQEEYQRSMTPRNASQQAAVSYPPPRSEYLERRSARRIAEQDNEEPMPNAAPRGRSAAYHAAKAYQEPQQEQEVYSVYQGESYDQPITPPTEQWEEEEEYEQETKLKIPWFGIAAALLAFLAVALWLMQLNFTDQTEQILIARERDAAALLDNHPYRYEELIEQEAAKNNLHPAFVAALVLNESSYNPQAESSVGARGLMQMMDDTAKYVYQKKNASLEGYQFDSLYTPEVNIEYGCWYLGYLSDTFHGDPILVAAGYHAGPTQVKNWLNDSTYSSDNLTLELESMKDGPTKRYAGRVLNDYAIYKRLYYQSTEDAI
ncbi:MAG: lytic transglycosylase domain-containing protein [Clostridiales bacterium]|nr:lytic transglycosylase domain-containing protein [Clostridiales bacterium]